MRSEPCLHSTEDVLLRAEVSHHDVCASEAHHDGREDDSAAAEARAAWIKEIRHERRSAEI